MGLDWAYGAAFADEGHFSIFWGLFPVLGWSGGILGGYNLGYRYRDIRY